MQEEIRFSVIVPTYNRAAFVGQVAECFIAQTHANSELVLVDDGSDDDTSTVIEPYLRQDERIRYFRKENGERGAARNYGLDRASGKYVTFLDSDDQIYPKHFATAQEFLRHHPDEQVFAIGYEVRDAHESLLACPHSGLLDPVNAQLLDGNPLSCIGVFLKKEVAQAIRFEEDRKLAGSEDWLMWLRVAARYPIRRVDRITACMIEHEGRSVLQFDEQKLNERTSLLIHYLKQDPVFMAEFGSRLGRIEAHMLSYTALHAALAKDRHAALRYLAKAGYKRPKELLKRRTLAVFKHLL